MGSNMLEDVPYEQKKMGGGVILRDLLYARYKGSDTDAIKQLGRCVG